MLMANSAERIPCAKHVISLITVSKGQVACLFQLLLTSCNCNHLPFILLNQPSTSESDENKLQRAPEQEARKQ